MSVPALAAARRRLFVLLASVLGLVAGSTVGLQPAVAADPTATIVKTITGEVPSCGIGTGLAFNGNSLLLSCWGSGQLWAVSPQDGHLQATYTIEGATDLGALSWDGSSGVLWACNARYNVVRINLATQTATLASQSQGCLDGLAFDATDSTIWTSDDEAETAQHFRTDGTPIGTFSVSSLLGGGNSGIAVGAGSLYLANPGTSQIFAVSRDFSSSTLFGTYPARLEDLECDDVTFGQAVMWSKDAYDAVLNAFAMPADSCSFGGGSGGISYPVSVKATPNPVEVGSHTVLLATVRNAQTGTPVPAGTMVTFYVPSGPDLGFADKVATDATGTAGALLAGKGAGTDHVVAWVDEDSDLVTDPNEFFGTTTVTWTETPTVYVALGDSFSSGEGNAPFDDGTNIDGNKCHRSQWAWPRQLGVSKAYHLACSGAVIRNLYEGQTRVGVDKNSQLNRLRNIDQALRKQGKHVDKVSLTISGNDVNFAGIITQCYTLECLGKPEQVEALVKAQQQRVTQALRDIAKAAPGAHIYLVGYPRMFPSQQAQAVGCGWLTPTERQRANTLALQLESMLSKAASGFGSKATYVSVLNALDGHELCTADSWVFEINPFLYGKFDTRQAHPLIEGQEAMGALVEKAMG